MSETAILGSVCAVLWTVLLGLVGVVWALLTGRISTLETTVSELRTQNTAQEVAIGRLTENAKGREETHAQHREDVQTQFARIDASLTAVNAKLDRLLSGGRGGSGGSPYPGAYGPLPRTDK